MADSESERASDAGSAGGEGVDPCDLSALSEKELKKWQKNSDKWRLFLDFLLRHVAIVTFKYNCFEREQLTAFMRSLERAETLRAQAKPKKVGGGWGGGGAGGGAGGGGGGGRGLGGYGMGWVGWGGVGVEWDGMGWDGMGWDGMGWGGMGRVGWGGAGWGRVGWRWGGVGWGGWGGVGWGGAE